MWSTCDLDTTEGDSTQLDKIAGSGCSVHIPEHHLEYGNVFERSSGRSCKTYADLNCVFVANMGISLCQAQQNQCDYQSVWKQKYGMWFLERWDCSILRCLQPVVQHQFTASCERPTHMIDTGQGWHFKIQEDCLDRKWFTIPFSNQTACFQGQWSEADQISSSIIPSRKSVDTMPWEEFKYVFPPVRGKSQGD